MEPAARPTSVAEVTAFDTVVSPATDGMRGSTTTRSFTTSRSFATTHGVTAMRGLTTQSPTDVDVGSHWHSPPR